MGLFSGKKILVLGVANERSIAWTMSQALHREGAELAFTFVNEAIEKRVRPLAESIACPNVLKCDVQSDAELDALFGELEARWGTIDGIVHSVAFAEREDLQNPFSKTTRKGFQLALDVSAYSLVAVAGRAAPLMKNGGSIVTLSYLGAERVVTNYNVMGVAKAALEASVAATDAQSAQAQAALSRQVAEKEAQLAEAQAALERLVAAKEVELTEVPVTNRV
jgi:enoyl-[acyl-carrier protein] reductase I